MTNIDKVGSAGFDPSVTFTDPLSRLANRTLEDVPPAADGKTVPPSDLPTLEAPAHALSIERLVAAIGNEMRRQGVREGLDAIDSQAQEIDQKYSEKLAEIAKEIDKKENQSIWDKICKVFRCIGMALGFIASIATIAAGSAMGNPALIVAGVAALLLTIDSVVSEATGGKVSLSAGFTELGKVFGLSDNTATNAAELTITDAVDENCSGSVKVEIPSVEPNSRGNVIVTFSYTVKHDHVWPALSANYLKPGTTNTVVVKGKLINNAWEMQSTMAEHFEGYLSDYGAAYAKNKENHGPITFALMPYISKDEAAKNGKVVSVATPQAEWPKGYVDQLGAAISGTDYTDQEIALTEPLVNNKTYVVTAYTVLDNGNYCEMTYYVEFVSPFEVTGKDIELKTLIADPSTEDVQELLVVNDLDGKVVYEKGAVTKYGADTYKLDDADFVFNYELIFKDKDHADLNPESDFNGDGVDHLSMTGSEVTWDNAGTTLQQDMHAAYSIELQVSDICVVDTEAGITVLSSANSK